MRFSVTTLVASALAGFASAYTQPVGKNPVGNPISRPGLNELIEVGTPYTITWTPTTPGTVTLVLLRGPSYNILPEFAIVEKIPNSGKYVWTPPKSLQPDTTHYGIQLIVDSDGQYQYTSQFGIANPNFSSSSAAAPKSTTTTAAASTASSPISQISDGQVQAPATSSPSVSSSASSSSSSSSSSFSSISSLTSAIPPPAPPSPSSFFPLPSANISTSSSSSSSPLSSSQPPTIPFPSSHFPLPANSTTAVRSTRYLTVPATLQTSPPSSMSPTSVFVPTTTASTTAPALAATSKAAAAAALRGGAMGGLVALMGWAVVVL